MTVGPQDEADGARRVLVIDDNEAILLDYRKILTPEAIVSAEMLAAEAALFGDVDEVVEHAQFEVVTASQGAEGHALAVAAAAQGRPFAMAFVDMRMPPGWDGLETIEHLWRDCPDLEIVICTAFNDYSWEETIRRLGRSDKLLIVKKPFDHVEIIQAASALTHKWRVQLQSERLLDGLADMVKERTKELEAARDELVAVNARLVVARDAAEAANRSKTMFLANMSHELRTPMTSIIGYARELEELCAREGGREFEHDAVRTIRRNGEHLIGLIGDLLDVAKLEAGKLSIERVPCCPLELMREVDAVVRPKAAAKQLELDVACATPVPATMSTDPLRLRQILVNVIDNAIKFTDTGSVRVSLSCVSGPDPRLVVDVVDTGIGMTPQALSRVFEPFEQADASTTRRFGGTGLGLAISRQLAELLGGDLRAESALGVGSRFRLRVATGPLDGVPMVRELAELEGRAPTTPPEPPRAIGARVLLAEDGRDNQRLIAHLLRKAGCEVELVENGVECVERVTGSTVPVDLVLMDVQMPIMSGLEAAEALRARGFGVPIVALTANAMPEDEAACIQAGCDAYLTKPIDRDRLVGVIRDLVAKREP